MQLLGECAWSRLLPRSRVATARRALIALFVHHPRHRSLLALFIRFSLLSHSLPPLSIYLSPPPSVSLPLAALAQRRRGRGQRDRRSLTPAAPPSRPPDSQTNGGASPAILSGLGGMGSPASQRTRALSRRAARLVADLGLPGPRPRHSPHWRRGASWHAAPGRRHAANRERQRQPDPTAAASAESSTAQWGRAHHVLEGNSATAQDAKSMAYGSNDDVLPPRPTLCLHLCGCVVVIRSVQC